MLSAEIKRVLFPMSMPRTIGRVIDTAWSPLYTGIAEFDKFVKSFADAHKDVAQKTYSWYVAMM